MKHYVYIEGSDVPIKCTSIIFNSPIMGWVELKGITHSSYDVYATSVDRLVCICTKDEE